LALLALIPKLISPWVSCCLGKVITVSIRWAVKMITIYNKKIHNICLFSGSEGGAISPEIALEINEVSRLIIVGAGGYGQSKEFEVLLQKELNGKKDCNVVSIATIW
jgi:hypothetical protein